MQLLTQTLELQTHAQMLTRCCRSVKNKISCVKLLRIFILYVGLIHAMLFWSQGSCLHSDLSVRHTSLYYAAIHQYFSILTGDVQEGGRIDKKLQDMCQFFSTDSDK